MAQINLLKHNTSQEQPLSGLSSVFVKLLVVLLIVAVGYYVFLFFQISSKAKASEQIRQAISKDKLDASLSKSRDELITRQAQLLQLDTLLTNHVYWSNIMPIIASSTLQSASYTTMKALQDGTITVGATVPSYEDLEKFLQVFNNPSVNKNFKDVRISGISREKVGDNVQIKFEARMRYNTDLLKYKKP